MPRNVRNYWIDLDVDGSKKRIATGPRSKDGGFDLTIKQRDRGEVTNAVEIMGRVNERGLLTLTIRKCASGPAVQLNDSGDTMTILSVR